MTNLESVKRRLAALTVMVHSDVDRIEKEIRKLRAEVEQLETEVESNE